MIQEPQLYIDEFVKAGAASITVHQEAVKHLDRVVQQIKDAGVKAAVAINPATPLLMIEEILSQVDMVLIMSVNPGFGGQEFIEDVVQKIAELREKMPDLDIQVDGGINAQTAKVVREAGANILVAGSYIFGAEDRKQAIEQLRIG